MEELSPNDTGRQAQVERLIIDTCNGLRDMLVSKNRSYGNAALDPEHITSNLGAVAGIRLRINDKLTRLKKGTAEWNEDTILDLAGYFILWRIALNRAPIWYPNSKEET
jgi:hypothetical protein